MIVALGLENVFLDIVFSTVLVRSVLECATVCYQSSECASLLYDHRAGNCHLCGQIFNGEPSLVTPAMGVNYYEFAPETTTSTTTTTTSTTTTTASTTTTTTPTTTTTTPTTTVYAPPGYTYEATLSCHYKVHTQMKNWDDARTVCQTEGGDLATATTATQRNFYISLVDSGEITSDAFMGGDNKSGAWKWLDGTSATGFTITYGTWENRCLDLDADLKSFYAENCADTQIFVCEYCSS